MKIAVLSYFPTESIYLTKRIRNKYPDTWIVGISWRLDPATESSYQISKARPKSSIRFYLNNILEKLIDRSTSLQKKLLFRERLNLEELKPDAFYSLQALRTKEFSDELIKREIDFLVTINAPILKPEVFEAPKYGSINFHFGIIPNYRGNHGFFWPFYFRDWNAVGITVHQIDQGIDTGASILKVHPKLFPWDTVTSAMVRATKLLGQVLDVSSQKIFMNRTIAQQANTSTRSASNTSGRLFRLKDLTLEVQIVKLISRVNPRSWPQFRKEQIIWTE